MQPYLGAPMNRFPPNLGCGCFSSCSTDTWYPKHRNPKKVFCDVIASVLYSYRGKILKKCWVFRLACRYFATLMFECKFIRAGRKHPDRFKQAFRTRWKFTYLEFSTCSTCPHHNPHNNIGFLLMRTCATCRKFKVCEFSPSAESLFKSIQIL